MSKCSICKNTYIRMRPMQSTCGPECALEKARRAEKKKRAREKKQALEKLKTHRDLQNDAQVVCNRYIRERDRGKPCISCGRNTGAKMNAGHYRTVGGNPELRYHPMNIHLQCEHCNSFKSGNIVEYRINLAKRIGEKNLAWLEGPHQPQNWTKEDLKEIKQYYKNQTKWIIDNA